MIKAFIFDMDGVIIDSEPLHFQSDRMVMKAYGIDITDVELNSFVGVTGALISGWPLHPQDSLLSLF